VCAQLDRRGSLRTEQSFSTDGGKQWELNWVMKLERDYQTHQLVAFFAYSPANP
jgi:hypothetical protein